MRYWFQPLSSPTCSFSSGKGSGSGEVRTNLIKQRVAQSALLFICLFFIHESTKIQFNASQAHQWWQTGPVAKHRACLPGQELGEGKDTIAGMSVSSKHMKQWKDTVRHLFLFVVMSHTTRLWLSHRSYLTISFCHTCVGNQTQCYENRRLKKKIQARVLCLSLSYLLINSEGQASQGGF